MELLFSKYWWLFIIRGIFLIFIGALALFMPAVAFKGLVLLFGAYMLADGLFAVIAATSERRAIRNWSWLLASGLLGILAGVLTFINPFATGTALVYLLAFWMLMAGISGVGLAIRLRKRIQGEGWYILTGILTIVFSLYVLFNPVVGAVVLAVMFGVYLFLEGAMSISLGMRLQNRRHRIMPIA